MANIEIRTVWQKDDPAASHDVVALWDESGAIFPKDRPDRLKELVAAAYVDGKIAGACTARPIDYKVLRAQVFHIRSTILAGAQHDEVLLCLLSSAKSVLQPWAQVHADKRLKGILAIFDSDAYDGLYAEPIIRWHGIELVLTGCTDEGRQIRTIWFDDAKLAK
jgi:hypothetical protein